MIGPRTQKRLHQLQTKLVQARARSKSALRDLIRNELAVADLERQIRRIEKASTKATDASIDKMVAAAALPPPANLLALTDIFDVVEQ